jgi:hypothetical protein
MQFINVGDALLGSFKKNLGAIVALISYRFNLITKDMQKIVPLLSVERTVEQNAVFDGVFCDCLILRFLLNGCK